MWSVRNNQYEDIEGATYRALFEEDDIAKEKYKKRYSRLIFSAV